MRQTVDETRQMQKPDLSQTAGYQRCNNAVAKFPWSCTNVSY